MSTESLSLKLETCSGKVAGGGASIEQEQMLVHAEKVKYPGHVINASELHPDNKRVKTITKTQRPRNVSELKGANRNRNAWDVVASTTQNDRNRGQTPTPSKDSNTTFKNKLERFDLTKAEKRTVAMRIRQIEKMWCSLHQRKLIKLDYILSKIFTRMEVSEQTRRCTPTAQKTLII